MRSFGMSLRYLLYRQYIVSTIPTSYSDEWWVLACLSCWVLGRRSLYVFRVRVTWLNWIRRNIVNERQVRIQEERDEWRSNDVGRIWYEFKFNAWFEIHTWFWVVLTQDEKIGSKFRPVLTVVQMGRFQSSFLASLRVTTNFSGKSNAFPSRLSTRSKVVQLNSMFET
jgi:hypothetical protein